MRLAVLSLAAVLVGAPAVAAEIRVLSGGAVQESVAELAQAYEKKTGHKVTARFAPMGKLREKLKAGEKADILFMTGAAMDAAAKEGTSLAGERVPLGRVMIGLAVKEGAPLPDIKTVEGFKKTLLAAKSIVIVDPSTGTSGAHLAKTFEKLGIAEAVKAKLKTLPGGRVAELVARDEAEIAVHQITEIMPVKGVKLVGPLPEEINLVSTYIGVATAGASPEARDFLAFTAGPEGRKLITAGGVDPGGS
ncbi:MAG: molybdate ABC transporter substrate-binding protein [Alphaproteobacteria bacterium]|nr:molybdate ABC transporter substrate-binding protein [Alphaproteobacteria bacterium]